jgi:hypothetical protein
MLINDLADAVINQFCSSGSFDLTRKRFEFLRRIPRPLWTPERRIKVDAACNDNGQIREAVLAGGQPVPDAVKALWEERPAWVHASAVVGQDPPFPAWDFPKSFPTAEKAAANRPFSFA